MAKQIFVSDKDIDTIVQEIRVQLKGMKSFGSIDIKKNFAKDDREAYIYFTVDAWAKMTALVSEFDTEVQWHGCVRRLSDCEFEIYDILVPPHVVTGSTVTSDQTKYAEWINGLDDETFNALHFHGHSHVNMECNPSGVDTKYRQDIVTQLPIPKDGEEDSFYIFLIFNKKGKWTGEIYDLKHNALYETKDIDIDVYVDNEKNFLSKFVADAKKMATREVVIQYGKGGYGRESGERGYGGYYGGYGGYGKGYGYDKNPVSGGGEKGGSAKKEKPPIAPVDPYFDDDDPRSPFYYNEYGCE